MTRVRISLRTHKKWTNDVAGRHYRDDRRFKIMGKRRLGRSVIYCYAGEPGD